MHKCKRKRHLIFDWSNDYVESLCLEMLFYKNVFVNEQINYKKRVNGPCVKYLLNI